MLFKSIQGDKMLNFEKLSKVYFSPSGTTQKIVNEIAKNFQMNMENYDLLSFDENKEFDDELVIIGMPVFDGRIPKLARKRLENLKGNNTKAIVVINYGNIDYGDALLELTEILKENNFHIFGICAAVSQHSLFNEVGADRPDAFDLKMINRFSQAMIMKLESGVENELFVEGKKPYPEYTNLKYDINCDDDLCVECMDCVYTCPEEAIPEENPLMTDMDKCSRCSTCISVCSENARSFCGDYYENQKEDAISNFSKRNEAEFFF